MGVAAATYIGEQLKAKNVSNPVIVEIAGIDNLQLTQDRSRGLQGDAVEVRLHDQGHGRPPRSPSSPGSR